MTIHALNNVCGYIIKVAFFGTAAMFGIPVLSAWQAGRKMPAAAADCRNPRLPDGQGCARGETLLG